MPAASDATRVVAGRYELQQQLGRGGMGVVYRAFDRVLDESVAIKLLLPQADVDDDAVRRFKSEIRLARRVTHPNVCRIHDYGDDGGRLYISMELVEGRDLKQVLRSGNLDADQAFDVALQVAAGLQAIHAVGIVHRDLKTPNLMRDSDTGRVRIMDFGIARSLAAQPGTVTATGIAVGTPDYMSPEQALGRRVDTRSDLYAFGVVVFELFTGELPFHGDTPMAVLLKHINEPPPLDASRRLPPSLVPVLKRALAKDVAVRYATAEEMAAALRQARDAGGTGGAETRALDQATPPADATPRPAHTEPRRLAAPALALAATAVALLAGTSALLWRARPKGVEPPASASAAPSPGVAAPPSAAPSPAARAPTPVAAARRQPGLGSPSPTPGGVRDEPGPSAVDEPAAAALPVGTRLLVTVETELRSDRAQVGDAFAASLAGELTWEGRVVAPAGTPLRGRVVGVSGRGTTPFLELALSEITLAGSPVPARTGAFRLTAPAAAGGTSVVAVIVGAAAGAALGAAAHGREGLLAGATAGAALGAASRTTAAGGSVFTYSDRLPFRLAEPLGLPPQFTQGRDAR